MVAAHQLIVTTTLIHQAAAPVHAPIVVGMKNAVVIPGHDHIDPSLLEYGDITW